MTEDVGIMEQVSLETALTDLPIGCTLLIHRTGNGYRLLLRDDMPLRVWEGAYIRDVEQVGEVAMYVIVLQEQVGNTPTGGS